MNKDKGFTIRKTTLQDVPRLMDIFAHARKFMAENGNPNQWKNIKPQIGAGEVHTFGKAHVLC